MNGAVTSTVSAMTASRYAVARLESGRRRGARGSAPSTALQVARNCGHADGFLIGRSGVALDGPFVKGGAGFTTTVLLAPTGPQSSRDGPGDRPGPAAWAEGTTRATRWNPPNGVTPPIPPEG